jgi:putative membrane protein
MILIRAIRETRLGIFVASSVSEGKRMRNGSSTEDHELAKNVVAGIIGGLVAAWTMEYFQRALGRVSEQMGGAEGGGGQQHRKPQSEPATYKAADAVAETVTGEEVPREYKPAAGSLVHYAFSGAVGAIYGAAATRTPDVTAWGGLPFGATVWLIADEMGVPLSGLSKAPTEYPLSSHMSALATHLVYGATTECVRRTMRKMV